MKKILLICIATFVFVNLTHAAEIMDGTNAPVTEQPRNNHAGSANTTIDQKPTPTKTETNKQVVIRVEEVKPENQNNGLYDNIRSGWNKFLDVLVGPKQGN